MVAELNASQEGTGQFLDLIYGNEHGYAYVATKAPNNASQFSQHFFEWPAQRATMLDFIQERSGGYEVYYSPALFDSKVAHKENVKGARVFWCEFDGSTPESLQGIPEPHVRVRSSIPGHEHWYWRVNAVVPVEVLEKVNRSLTYILGADVSGWDANQILRPINTMNHKRGAEVSLLSIVEGLLAPSSFGDLPAPPPPPDVPVPDEIPAIEDVIPQYKFPPEVWHLFKEGMPQGKRSEGLMSLGYYLAEMQLQDDEIFTLLLNADERWGKFAGRNDQYKRLMEIVVRARQKYPLVGNTADDEIDFVPFGFQTLLSIEQEVDWVWKGLLHTTGYMLVSGPSGVGKTQFTLNAIARLVLGQSHLGFDVEAVEQKVAFFSLEMGLEEIKQFLKTQAQNYTAEELKILEERFKIFPLGEPIYLTKDEEKKRIEGLIEEHGFTGIVFDSLGSVTEASLSNEENVKNLMDWNDRLRKRHRVFTWYIHHNRKANGDNKKPNKLGDVYGSQYITARTSTVLILWPVNESTVEIIPVKTRFSAKPQAFHAHRDKFLHFYTKVPGITVLPETTDAEVVKPEPEPVEGSSPKQEGGISF